MISYAQDGTDRLSQGRAAAMLAHRELDRLAQNGAKIQLRLRARISPWELFALALAFSVLGIALWIHSSLNVFPNDLYDYLQTARGNFAGYYYAYWMLPIFSLLESLPPYAAYGIWGALNILCVFFALRVFGGRVPVALLSFQMFYVIFVGQIIGVISAGLALLWWGLNRRSWLLAGLGLTIACTKYHIGVVMGAALLLIAEVTWRERLRALVVPAAALALSLIVFPGWPLDVLATLRTTPANDWGSIALWRWIGPYALILWIPPMLLPLSRPQRLAAIAATMALALPYFQQTDLLTLFILPIGWGYILLGNLGYLFFAIYWGGLQLLAVVPVLVYLSLIVPAALRLIPSFARRQSRDNDSTR